MKIDDFVNCLEKELEDRYNACEDFATTPCSILLAVLNAVAGAKITASQQVDSPDEKHPCDCDGLKISPDVYNLKCLKCGRLFHR